MLIKETKKQISNKKTFLVFSFFSQDNQLGKKAGVEFNWKKN